MTIDKHIEDLTEKKARAAEVALIYTRNGYVKGANRLYEIVQELTKAIGILTRLRKDGMV